MPTVFSHAIVGLAAATAFPDQSHPERLYGLSVLCSVLPDADVAGFVIGIPYGHLFGHRGFFHSLLFALVIAVVVVCLAFREDTVFSWGWWGLLSYFFLLSASHGILDTLTKGGLGTALLSPFDTTRFNAPVALFEAAPLTLDGLFTPWGLRVLKKEFMWIWIPCLAVMVWVRYRQCAPS